MLSDEEAGRRAHPRQGGEELESGADRIGDGGGVAGTSGRGALGGERAVLRGSLRGGPENPCGPSPRRASRGTPSSPKSRRVAGWSDSRPRGSKESAPVQHPRGATPRARWRPLLGTRPPGGLNRQCLSEATRPPYSLECVEGEFLGTSPLEDCAYFAFWVFSEVRYPQATPSNTKDSSFE